MDNSTILLINNIIMDFKEVNSRRSVHLTQNGNVVGEFRIDGRLNIDDLSMTIGMDDHLWGKGLAKLMVGFMIINMPNTSKHQLIFIDADASNGFWKHIGMQENRYYSRQTQRNILGRGYEMEITFSKLSLWAV